MRNRGASIACALALGPILASCVSLKRTPEARFFVLRAAAPPVASDVAELRDGSVGVLPVRLPGHLDRSQVVTEAGPNEVLVDEFARWAEPLGPAITRVVAENLAALLPDRLVVRSPFSARAGLRCKVVVEVEAFAPQANGEVHLDGRWALLSPKGPGALAVRNFRLRRGPVPVGPSGVDASAGTAAMSELLGELAAQIADGVRGLPEPIQEEILQMDSVRE